MEQFKKLKSQFRQKMNLKSAPFQILVIKKNKFNQYP